MKVRKNFLPYCLPFIGKEEIDEVIDTLKSGWLSMGPKTLRFEKDFAKYIGVKHALSVNSCTAALHLALLAHNIGPGDEVILPAFTFASTANVVVHVGAKPVFADIQEKTFNIDPKDIQRKITKKTKAIIVVHYGGKAADLSEVSSIAKKSKLIVIEDAAHAVGTKYKNKLIGTHGNTTCYSFYATKNLTTGEGGMLTTNSDQVADFVMKNRLHGISSHAWKRYSKGGKWQYEVEYGGWKYNMTDVAASLGIHQLKRLNTLTRKRRSLASIYSRLLGKIKGITLPIESPDRYDVYHLYPILIESMKRDSFIDSMTKMNIGTSVHFIPLHLQPFYKNKFGYKKGDLPVTEMIFSKIVSLPLYPSLKESDQEYVADAIKMIILKNSA